MKYSDENMNNLTEDLTAMITSTMNQIKISKSSPDRKDSSKEQNPTNVVPTNKRVTTLEGVHSTKIVACGLSSMRSSDKDSMESSPRQN